MIKKHSVISIFYVNSPVNDANLGMCRFYSNLWKWWENMSSIKGNEKQKKQNFGKEKDTGLWGVTCIFFHRDAIGFGYKNE